MFFAMLSASDKAIIETEFGGSLQRVDAQAPEISQNVMGRRVNFSLPGGHFKVYQFTPSVSGEYAIFTSPYEETGVNTDTYLEVYTNPQLSGTPLMANDDYNNSKFSKIVMNMTGGTTYYVKVRNYQPDKGMLHAQLYIQKSVTEKTLNLDEGYNIIVAATEFALYKFTPSESGNYTFAVSKYGGSDKPTGTYIKLYADQALTQRIAQHEKKIIRWLDAGQTYYLQFSGLFMKAASGRVTVRKAHTLEFKKRTGSNFIFVNSPEYITKYDIVDDTDTSRDKVKIFEQSGIMGKNTFFETHLAFYSTDDNMYDKYKPKQTFYLDVDFYNESDVTVTVDISNLAYGNHYQVMSDYYNGHTSYSFTLAPGEHKLLFESPGAPLPTSNSAQRPTVMFDFEVSGGSVMVSSLAAYSRSNLYLQAYMDGTLPNGTVLGRGYPEIDYQSTRESEGDYYGKYKGTAWNESAWIDANLEFAINDSTELGVGQPIYLKDSFYDTVQNPKRRYQGL